MEIPQLTRRSTAQMLDTCAGSTTNTNLQELRSATAAFLADRHDDGTYVATAEDIVDLQEATAMLLADLADEESACLGSVGLGLLLPDEQILLPIADAVNRIRGAAVSAIDLFGLIDECLDAEMTCETSMDTPLPDATTTDVTTEDALSHTLPQDALTDFVEDHFALQEELYDAIDDLLGERSGMNGQAFDASDITCRFKASNAAAFFDPVVDAVVPYASFDQLLEIAPTSPPAHFTDRATLKVITKLPTILEEGVQWSAASDSSIDFADHRRFVKPIESRRENFLDNDEELDVDKDFDHDNHEFLPSKTGEEQFDGFFGDDIWTNAPDLDLALPVSQPLFSRLVDEADHELLGAFLPVLEAMLAHSPSEMLTLVADIKRKLHILMDDMERLALTGRLDDFIDAAVNCMATLDQSDRIVY